MPFLPKKKKKNREREGSMPTKRQLLFISFIPRTITPLLFVVTFLRNNKKLFQSSFHVYTLKIMCLSYMKIQLYPYNSAKLH